MLSDFSNNIALEAFFELLIVEKIYLDFFY